MKKARTVIGDIDCGQLGWTQCHEHLFIEKGKSFDINQALFMDDYKKTLDEVELYKNAGGHSVVDAQPVGCGRMAEYLERVSVSAGVNIIASTGFHKTIFYNDDSLIYKKSEQDLCELFVNEIENGMYSSIESGFEKLDCKAGIIKTAVDCEGIYKDGCYEKLFEAAAEASLRTNVSIMCHMEKGADAHEIITFFSDKGIDKDKVILCHLDRTKYDYRYHEDLADTGVFLEYDTIHRLKYHEDDQEAKLIAHMVKKGYEKQLLLSLDTTNKRLKSYGAEFRIRFHPEVIS